MLFGFFKKSCLVLFVAIFDTNLSKIGTDNLKLSFCVRIE